MGGLGGGAGGSRVDKGRGGGARNGCQNSSSAIRLLGLGVGLLENKLLDGGVLLLSSLLVVTAVAPAVRIVSIDDDRSDWSLAILFTLTVTVGV